MRLYNKLFRLLQIEGPEFADNVADTFAEEGIPEDKVEEILDCAIGADFHRIRLIYWPDRLRDRLNLDVTAQSRIRDALILIAKAWKEKANAVEPDIS